MSPNSVCIISTGPAGDETTSKVINIHAKPNDVHYTNIIYTVTMVNIRIAVILPWFGATYSLRIIESRSHATIPVT